ncbi:hypothetical protein [Fusibacter ferrireducens]|uniref:Uncharacterized protein n=1 Tax=Fusibacter ferrireducens TaxID=2785058 RepID=A0ABR9ZZZ0_9FIRM|nr:hypothetical protein [Fusibacter ferrireducens]MBF4695460.1 hypothetical protein [Fusibacter ferrireducens]
MTNYKKRDNDTADNYNAEDISRFLKAEADEFILQPLCDEHKNILRR